MIGTGTTGPDLLLSVVTPLSATGNPYVAEAFRSLRAQSLSAWQWVVVRNNGGELPAEASSDPRVRVVESDSTQIGTLKGLGCRSAVGDVFVELDHDDLLAPDALARVAAEVECGADFVFSDFAEFVDGTWAPNVYGEAYGWRSYPVEFEGHALRAMHAPPCTSQNVRRIELAPNHVRAWRREAYERVGGHRELSVGDDHDLTVRGLLAGWQVRHVPACLYFYRVHAANTVKARNAEIQAASLATYQAHALALARSFAAAHGLRAIDLCGGREGAPGFESLDLVGGVDLNGAWPLADSSVGVLRAVDAVEHLQRPIHTMNEAHRVLAPGGWMLIEVPSTDGRGAFQDPTHVSFWNSNSFWYYTDRDFARYVPESRARFQLIHLEDYFPSAWHESRAIVYTRAHLLALKDGFEPMGEVHI